MELDHIPCLSLKQIIESYNQGEFLLFSNAAPLQIESVFNDYYLDLGIEPAELNNAALHKKLDIISDKVILPIMNIISFFRC